MKNLLKKTLSVLVALAVLLCGITAVADESGKTGEVSRSSFEVGSGISGTIQPDSITEIKAHCGKTGEVRFTLTLTDKCEIRVSVDGGGVSLECPDGSLPVYSFKKHFNGNENHIITLTAGQTVGYSLISEMLPGEPVAEAEPQEATEDAPAAETEEEPETVPAEETVPAAEPEEEPSTDTVPAAESEEEPATETVPAEDTEEELATDTVPAAESEEEPAAETVPATEPEEEPSTETAPAENAEEKPAAETALVESEEEPAAETVPATEPEEEPATETAPATQTEAESDMDTEPASETADGFEAETAAGEPEAESTASDTESDEPETVPETEEPAELPADETAQPDEQSESSLDGQPEEKAESAADSAEIIIAATLTPNDSWHGTARKSRPTILKLDVAEAQTIHMFVEGKDTLYSVQKSDRVTEDAGYVLTDAETNRSITSWNAEPGSYLINLLAGEYSLGSKVTISFKNDDEYAAWKEIEEAKLTEKQTKVEIKGEYITDALNDEEMLTLGYYKVQTVKRDGADVFMDIAEGAEAIDHLPHGIELWVKPTQDISWAEIYNEGEQYYIKWDDLLITVQPEKDTIDEAEKPDEQETTEVPDSQQEEIPEVSFTRSLRIHSTLDDMYVIPFNAEITMQAELVDFREEDLYSCQWQYSADGITYADIEGANSLTYIYTISEKNLHYWWRVIITLENDE